MKDGITIRGDNLYCPLPISIEVYWYCEANCHHCYLRHLNHVWGKDLRPIDIPALEKKLINGIHNKNPKSSIAFALRAKKTLRIGNKADAFQDAEKEYLRSTETIKLLRRLRWTFVIQTRFTSNLMELADEQIQKSNKFQLATLLPVISPGLEKDWEIFERKRTTPIHERVKHIRYWLKNNIPLGVNGEPFIPGFHTVKDFFNTIKLLKSIGVKSYNIYNFHFNAYVAKKIYDLPGVDIEKIWEFNQDDKWRPILRELLDIAKKNDIILGCPDFVNSGWDWKEQANTCCGITVKNPCYFNSHHFKWCRQDERDDEENLKMNWEGIGDYEKGKAIIYGTSNEFFTLKDVK